jgi:hypothetical protein
LQAATLMSLPAPQKNSAFMTKDSPAPALRCSPLAMGATSARQREAFYSGEFEKGNQEQDHPISRMGIRRFTPRAGIHSNGAGLRLNLLISNSPISFSMKPGACRRARKRQARTSGHS